MSAEALTATIPPEYLSTLDSILEPNTSVPADPAERERKEQETKTETKTDPPGTETKVAETKTATVADDNDPPESLPNQGRQDVWKNFRGKYKDTKTELKTLKEQLATKEKTLADFEETRKEYDEMKSRFSDLEKRNEELGRIDSLAKLENHPDFRAKYVTAREQQAAKVAQLAELSDIKSEEIFSTLSKPPKEKYQALDDLLSGAPSSLRTKIMAAIDSIESLDEARTSELNTARESLSKLEEKRSIQMKEHATREDQTRAAIFDDLASKMAKDLGLTAEATADARKFFLGNDDLKEAALAVLERQSAKSAKESKAALEKEIADLRKEVAVYKGATPGLTAGATESSGDEPRTGEDYVAFMLRKAREASGR